MITPHEAMDRPYLGHRFIAFWKGDIFGMLQWRSCKNLASN
jgi:hypothetical protein